MSDNFRFAQLQPFSLAGAGSSIGDTSLILKSFKDIDGATITMAGNFGTIGFGTIEPGSRDREEQISFTGVTNNTNGTSTLTGVSTVLFSYPYTKTSGIAKSHPGGVNFVISNTSGFYDELTSKDDDETINGTWTFPSDDVHNARIGSDVDTTIATAFVTLGQLSRQAISGASNASTTVKGIVQEATQPQVDSTTATGSTGARLYTNPSTLRSKLLSDFRTENFVTASVTAASPAVVTFASHGLSVGDTVWFVTGSTLPSGLSTLTNYYVISAGLTANSFELSATSGGAAINTTGSNSASAFMTRANTYLISPNPQLAAYTAGQILSVQVNNSNTGSATLNANSLGVKTIKKNGGTTNLGAGDIVAGEAFQVQYDGTNFQLITPVAGGFAPGIMEMYAGATAPSGWLLCDGTSYLQTSYAALFAVISTTYGSADGTHFNVPDMRGRVPLGVGTGTGGGASGTGLPTGGSALTAVSRGTWKGEETHTQSIAEMPAHNHTGTYIDQAGSGALTGIVFRVFGTTAATQNVPSEGSGTAFNVIQPTMGVNFIIKT